MRVYAGNKATHDFLSLYAPAAAAAAKDSSLQLHDSKPPAASQGSSIRTSILRLLLPLSLIATPTLLFLDDGLIPSSTSQLRSKLAAR